MSRASTVEFYSARLAEPDRIALRASILAQRAGKLDAAAELVCARVDHRRDTLAWPALLLALDSAELRLGGAVELTTPSRRFSKIAGATREFWGSFTATIYPREAKVGCEVAQAAAEYRLVTAPEPRSLVADAADAMIVLSHELCAYLGAAVRLG